MNDIWHSFSIAVLLTMAALAFVALIMVVMQ
jgi:hypothetical protein